MWTSKRLRSPGKNTMPKRTSEFREQLLADLADPDEAAHYVNAALADSEKMALVALRDVAEARQMAKVAKESGVAREALYRMLSGSGNPTFENLSSVLKTIGLKILVAPIHPNVSNTCNAENLLILRSSKKSKIIQSDRGKNRQNRGLGHPLFHERGMVRMKPPSSEWGMMADAADISDYQKEEYLKAV
jgi:probable addiction module antidote protein